MNTDRKAMFAIFLGWSGLTILLSAFFLTLFGVVDLRYVNNFQLFSVFEFIINFIIFNLSVCMIIKIIHREAKRTFILSLIFSITSLISHFINFITVQNQYITAFVIPIIFLLLTFIIYRVDCKTCIVFVISLILIYFILGTIKTNFNFFDYKYTNAITTLVLSTDLILMYIFCESVVKLYGMVAFPWKLVFLPKTKSVFSNENTSKETLETCDLTARQKAFFALMVIGYQVMQLLVVLAIGALNNMFVELLIMLPMFWIGRTILQKSWHSNKLWICSVATFSGFYILTKVTPPFEISLFLIVALTGTFVYLLHILGVKADRLDKLEELINPEILLKQKCIEVGMSPLLTEICIDWKINKLSRQQQADKYGYALNTIRKYRNDIENLLKTK